MSSILSASEGSSKVPISEPSTSGSANCKIIREFNHYFLAYMYVYLLKILTNLIKQRITDILSQKSIILLLSNFTIMSTIVSSTCLYFEIRVLLSVVFIL